MCTTVNMNVDEVSKLSAQTMRRVWTLAADMIMFCERLHFVLGKGDTQMTRFTQFVVVDPHQAN